VMEACSTARAQAILTGRLVELRIRPQDYTFEVATTGKSETSSSANATSGVARTDEGHNQFSVKLHANGTSDEFTVVLRSLYGDIRKIALDPVTGRADFEVLR